MYLWKDDGLSQCYSWAKANAFCRLVLQLALAQSVPVKGLLAVSDWPSLSSLNGHTHNNRNHHQPPRQYSCNAKDQVRVVADLHSDTRAIIVVKSLGPTLWSGSLKMPFCYQFTMKLLEGNLYLLVFSQCSPRMGLIFHSQSSFAARSSKQWANHNIIAWPKLLLICRQSSKLIGQQVDFCHRYTFPWWAISNGSKAPLLPLSRLCLYNANPHKRWVVVTLEAMLNKSGGGEVTVPMIQF